MVPPLQSVQTRNVRFTRVSTFIRAVNDSMRSWCLCVYFYGSPLPTAQGLTKARRTLQDYIAADGSDSVEAQGLTKARRTLQGNDDRHAGPMHVLALNRQTIGFPII